MQNNFTTLADNTTIQKVIEALQTNGMNAEVVDTKEAAKNRVLELIPEGAEVMTMTSITLDQAGIVEAINSSSKYSLVKKKLAEMDRETQSLEMQKIGAAPEYAVGSVHAVTQDGHVIVASNTGSQLAGYIYGSPHVIWVVSTKKIVENTDEGLKRIYDHILPLESARARKAYNLPDTYNSFVSKLAIFNREVNKGRITIIFVKEDLGF